MGVGNKSTGERKPKPKRIERRSSAVMGGALAICLLLTLPLSLSDRYSKAERQQAVAFVPVERKRLHGKASGSAGEQSWDTPYDRAEALLAEGNAPAALGILMELAAQGEQEARERCYEIGLWRTVSAGGYCTLGLRNEGTVIGEGWEEDEQRKLDTWTDIASVSAVNCALGLRWDGTVCAVGRGLHSKDIQHELALWTDIVDVAAGYDHVVGLRSDGTVLVAGDAWERDAVSQWTDIVDVAAGASHTVGLRRDGTVLVTNWDDSVSGWTDIVAVETGLSHVVGLRRDGTVVAEGGDHDECAVEDWTDIAAISAQYYGTMGLRRDGTVLAVGYEDFDCLNVSGWREIVAVSRGAIHTVGLRSDGTVLVAGDFSQLTIAEWTDIRVPRAWGGAEKETQGGTKHKDQDVLCPEDYYAKTETLPTEGKRRSGVL